MLQAASVLPSESQAWKVAKLARPAVSASFWQM